RQGRVGEFVMPMRWSHYSLPIAIILLINTGYTVIIIRVDCRKILRAPAMSNEQLSITQSANLAFRLRQLLIAN
ncbi:MAG: hypothetical protein IJG38_08345, partial [Thermoguttaceae bacterium]|nr:hypothetical protein [Thermoguttaceae bacterium]